MIYILTAVNILWLLMLTAFIFYSVAKGQVVISPRQVLDKETSIQLAKAMQEQMQQDFGGY